MRQEIVVGLLVGLLAAAFVAVWALGLPTTPDIAPASRMSPTATPPVDFAATLTALPAILTPPPTATPPPPTASPTNTPPPPTARPTPTPTPRPTPTPSPTPAPMLFLEVRSPRPFEVARGLPRVEVQGVTLPGSVILITYTSSSQPDRVDRLPADSNGAFTRAVPLSLGFNVIEIVSVHGSSNQEVRRSVPVEYDPTPLELTVSITEPADGAVVTGSVLEVSGKSLPGALVVLNDNAVAEVDDNGSWQTNILLQPGRNEIRVMASQDGDTVEDAITVTYTR